MYSKTDLGAPRKVHGVKVDLGMNGCARACLGVCGCVQVCAGICVCVQVYKGV